MADLSKLSVKELRGIASDMDIPGRSKLGTREQLIDAIEAAQGPDNPPSKPEPSDESVTSKPVTPTAQQKMDQARADLRAARHSLECAESRSMASGIDFTKEPRKRLQDVVKAYNKAKAALNKAKAKAAL